MIKPNLFIEHALLTTKLYVVLFFTNKTNLKNVLGLAFCMFLGGFIIGFSHLWVYPILGVSSLMGENGLFSQSWPIIIGGHIIMFTPVYIIGMFFCYLFYRLDQKYTLDIDEIKALKFLKHNKDIEIEATILNKKIGYTHKDPDTPAKKLTQKNLNHELDIYLS